jgi:hypothetical protein
MLRGNGGRGVFLPLSGGTLSGDLLFSPDATYDIGKSGLTRPRHGYFSGNLVSGGLALGGATIGTNALAVTGTAAISSKVAASAFENAASQPFYFTGRSAMWSTVDGNIVLTNNANTDFSRLQFGGTTSSFPAIKRNGAALQVRLADDSANAGLISASLDVSTFLTAGTTSYINWSAGSRLTSPADGQLLVQNNAATDFSRLQFGGTTNLFPAIKRNGAAFDLRLADDSGYASLALGNTLTMTSSSSFYPQAVLANLVADANGPYLILRKGRATGTTTQNGDTLGNILFSGYASDNSTFNGPSISVIATGAASATGIATSTIFNTSTSSGGTEAFRYDTNGSVSVIGSVTSRRTTAIPAGGTAGVGVLFSSTSNYGTFFGSGAPTLSAAKGSLYLRSDGTGVADRMYVNTNGSTTWTAVTTVA